MWVRATEFIRGIQALTEGLYKSRGNIKDAQ